MDFKPLVIIAALVSSAHAQAQAPDANAILQGARISATLTQLDKKEPLKGSLSKDGGKTPIALFLDGKNIQFQFNENNAWRVFHMRLSDEKYDLFEFINDKQQDFPEGKLTQAIAGTDLTYEDLSLRFFYWPNPTFQGQDNVNGEPCYKLRIDKPKGSPGRYDVVYVWVHTRFGAFMQVRGYNKKGGLLKEFQVQDVMKVAENVWTLRKMQVATCDPDNGDRRVSITNVTFDDPKKIVPRGLH
jgi:hypothetical protein